jgi:hypothetical protein
MKRIILSTVISALLLVVRVSAQGLTDAQYLALNQDVLVTHQAEFAAAVAVSDFAAIAAAYNLQAAPVFWIWRTQLSAKEIYEATSPDNTTWNWTTYIGQSVQERDGWQTMIAPGPLNPSLPQVRDAYNKIFGGTGAAATQRAHLLAMSRREALRGEMLFANTSAGNGTTATPASLTYIGYLTYNDVYYALTGQRP